MLSYARIAVHTLAYKNLLPARWRRRLIERFWDNQAEMIHTRWGAGHDDYVALGSVLKRYRPATLLDAGCGSGRLFPLYWQEGVERVVGVDIAETALAIAHTSYPEVELHCNGLLDLNFAGTVFDFCVCNRVLQHIPPAEIDAVAQRLTRISRLVYVNELTESDGQQEIFFMRRYHYPILFERAGFRLLESGLIDRQTYYVFGGPSSNLKYSKGL